MKYLCIKTFQKSDISLFAEGKWYKWQIGTAPSFVNYGVKFNEHFISEVEFRELEINKILE